MLSQTILPKRLGAKYGSIGLTQEEPSEDHHVPFPPSIGKRRGRMTNLGFAPLVVAVVVFMGASMSTSGQASSLSSSSSLLFQFGSSRFLSTSTTAALGGVPSIIHQALCSPLDASLEGALVHLQGCHISHERLKPPLLGENDPIIGAGVSPKDRYGGIRLEAYSRVYQWEEMAYTKKVGNRNVRDHMYFREWYTIEPPANTSFFGEARKCRVDNANLPCYQWDPALVESWWSEAGYELGLQTVDVVQSLLYQEDNSNSNVILGDYSLPVEVMKSLSRAKVLEPTCRTEAESTSNSTSRRRQLQEERHLSDNVDDETTGLLSCLPYTVSPPRIALDDNDEPRLVWQQLDSNGEMIDYLTRQHTLYQLPDTISILAQQRGNSFVPWQRASSESAEEDDMLPETLFVFAEGNLSATQLLELAKSASSSQFQTTFGVWFTLLMVTIQTLCLLFA
jgi:hypothetical protein